MIATSSPPVPEVATALAHASSQAPAPAPARNLAEAARYFAASLAALALDAGLLWLLVEGVGMRPWAGGAIAYLAGLVLIYLLSIRWVFAERVLRDPRREFAIFAALGGVGLMLNSLVLTIGLALGLALPAAKVLSAGIGFVANFAGRKLVLFSR